MCGIVGFTGKHQAAPILLDGLSRLEYRGYDSAGIAIRDGENRNRSHQSKRQAEDSGRKNGSWSVGSGNLRNRAYSLGNSWRALRLQMPIPIEVMTEM